METEGVVQYRLLGSHPAASGRYHSFGFSGEVVAVSALLQDIVKQHQINLTKYKLEIRRLMTPTAERQETQAPSGSAENGVLQLNSMLRTYDRIVVNISRRHYMDGMVEAAQEEGRARGDCLQQVEGMLRGQDETTSPDLVIPLPTTGSDTIPNAGDPHAFSRVTTLSSKAFPLLPCLLRRDPTSRHSLPRPIKGKCVLCELECLEERVLSCCGFSACGSCLELAKTMLMEERECAVCGAVPGEQNTSNTGGLTGLLPVKREGQCMQVVGAADNKQHIELGGRSHWDTRNGPGVKGAQTRSPRTSSMITAYEKDLMSNMARILSFLDVADPLTAEVKKKRRISPTLALYTQR